MPQNPIRTDYTNRVFGRLTAKRFYCPDGSAKRHWVCECSCGAQVVVTANNLKSGNVRSCGCMRQDSARNAGARRVARMRNSLAAYARRNGVEPAALHYHVRKGRSKQEGVARILRNNRRPFKSKWDEIDLTLPTEVICRKMGVSQQAVDQQRRKRGLVAQIQITYVKP